MNKKDKKNTGSISGIDLTVVNAATGQPVVYQGETDTLAVTLTNNTGGSIGLLAGSQPSTLEIFLPEFYLLKDLQKMQINLPGWTFAVNNGDESLVLTCTTAGSWASGAALGIQITGVQSAAKPPQGGVTQINPSGMTGSNIPSQALADAPLTLQLQSNGNKADLKSVLEITLDNGGLVYVSENTNMLIPNTLSLNIKNAGAKPLYTGSTPWHSSPQALVYFAYGSTSGALAPDGKTTPQQESAWNIQPGSVNSEGNSWGFAADNSGQANQPQWLLTPNASDPGILGIGTDANITFQFNNIVSLTPPGHTQMYVQFSGFPGYNDALFVLDIEKDNPPDTEEILNFLPLNLLSDLVVFNDIDDTPSVTFAWELFQLNSIVLMMTNDALGINQQLCKRSYNTILSNDQFQTQLPKLPAGNYPFVFILNGFDEYGNQKSQMSSTVTLQSQVAPGILQFTSDVSVLSLEPEIPAAVTLQWEVFGAGFVELSCQQSALNIPAVQRQYTLGSAGEVFTDSATIQLPVPAIYNVDQISFQLTMTDPDGKQHTMACSMNVQMVFKDPRDGKVYPVIIVDKKFWMAANLEYVTPTANDMGMPCGCVYTDNSFLTDMPAGWQLPSPDDWENLAAQYTSAELWQGGSTGLNLMDCASDYVALGTYFLSDSSNTLFMGIIMAPPTSIKTMEVVGLDQDSTGSVRLVKDFPG